MTKAEFKKGVTYFSGCFGKFSPTEVQEGVWWDLLETKNLDPDIYLEAVMLVCEKTEKWFDNMNFVAMVLNQVEDATGNICIRKNELHEQWNKQNNEVKLLPLSDEQRIKNNREGLRLVKMELKKQGIDLGRVVKRMEVSYDKYK